jgi:hypothetical protein
MQGEKNKISMKDIRDKRPTSSGAKWKQGTRR